VSRRECGGGAEECALVIRWTEESRVIIEGGGRGGGYKVPLGKGTGGGEKGNWMVNLVEGGNGRRGYEGKGGVE